jgi:hypothetical protein
LLLLALGVPSAPVMRSSSSTSARTAAATSSVYGWTEDHTEASSSGRIAIKLGLHAGANTVNVAPVGRAFRCR